LFLLVLLSELYLSTTQERYLPDQNSFPEDPNFYPDDADAPVEHPIPSMRRLIMRLIIEHNHSRCPFKPHHLLYLRNDVSPDLMGTSLAETAMTSWHVPHWQARNLTQIQGLLIIPEHPTRREPIPLPEFLSRFSYIATKQLHGDWSKPDSDYNLLPQQLIPETSEDEPHTVSLNEDAVGSPLLSALRHPSIMKKLDAYAEYVRDCYTLVYERFNWAELAEAVLSNDGHYIMQFVRKYNRGY
jgi:hypothetical protein